MKHFKASSVLFLINIIFSSFFWAQDEQPYPPLNLVSIPTAGTLPRGSYTMETLLIKTGGLIPKLSVGLTENFSFGVSFGIQNLIGDENPKINKPTPEVQVGLVSGTYSILDSKTLNTCFRAFSVSAKNSTPSFLCINEGDLWSLAAVEPDGFCKPLKTLNSKENSLETH